MEKRVLRGTLPYLIVLVISVGLFINAGQIGSGGGSSDQHLLGPAFWPQLILVLAMCVCIFEISFHWFFDMEGVCGLLSQVTHEMERAEGGVEGIEDEPTESNPWRLAAGVGLTLIYVWLLPTIGFTLATLFYIGLFIWLGGYRRMGVVASVSLLGTLALVFIFMKIVYVSLPLGTGVFGKFSVALLPLLGIH